MLNKKLLQIFICKIYTELFKAKNNNNLSSPKLKTKNEH